MIYYRIPWSTDKNLSKAYNREMELIPTENDYCCFIDRDAMFLHPFYGLQIEHIIENSNFDLYTCMTNRVNCKQQLHGYPSNWRGNDIENHINIATRLYEQRKYEIEDITGIIPGISGMVMILKKSTWSKIGGFKGQGMLGIDNQLHYDVRDCGGKVMLMRGVYVYHYYRNGDCKNTKHLI
jgi:GT2 family glycosyltransferase